MGKQIKTKIPKEVMAVLPHPSFKTTSLNKQCDSGEPKATQLAPKSLTHQYNHFRLNPNDHTTHFYNIPTPPSLMLCSLRI